MRRTFAVLAALLLAVAVAGPAAAAKPAPTLLVGFVTDGPVLYDSGFVESTWNGVQAGAEAIGADAVVVVSQKSNDKTYATNIKRLVKRGAGIIVTVGFLMTPATAAAAAAYPSVQFFGADQGIEDPWPANYQGLVFASAKSGYLAGIVAAHTTATDKVGMVGVDLGGLVVPKVLAFMNGYRNGVASVDPGIAVVTGYATSFSETRRAGTPYSSGLIDQGADVVFGVAGVTTYGVLKAACDRGVWGIGVDVDQWLGYTDLQGCIITSAVKNLTTATSNAIQRWWAGGTDLRPGLFMNPPTAVPGSPQSATSRRRLR